MTARSLEHSATARRHQIRSTGRMARMREQSTQDIGPMCPWKVWRLDMNGAQRLLAAVAAVALVLTGAVGAFLIAGGDSSPSPQSVQAQRMMDDRGISVEGHGQISVSPDVAQVTLGVELEGSDLDSIRAEADERMNDMIDALLDLGIDEADIRTTAYDIWVRDEQVEPMRSEAEQDVVAPDAPASQADDDDAVTDEEDDAVTDDDDDAVTDEEDDAVTDDEDDVEVDPGTGTQTYVLTQMVQVRIADIDMTGEVIDTALDNGANRVANIRFEVEDRQEAIEQAREMAVDEARAKAEHLAELTGVSAGAPLKIDEHSPSGPAMRMDDFDMAMEEAAEGEMMSRIEPGEQVISVNVYITYAIE
ncbi:MAG: DUF541 domain-containing protein [Sphaerobacteraceae bacterium]|nr:MAG: DUF541 domain-containing protein [Sphaerobacteraceae bacterium]